MAAPDPRRTASGRSTAIRLLDGVDRFVGQFCKMIVMSTGTVLLLAIFAGVLARYIIRVGGVDWAEELPKQLFSWFIMAGVVLAVKGGNHIAVELILNFLSSPAKRCLIVATNLLVCAAYVYLFFTALEVAGIAAAETNPMLGTPNSLPFYALAGGSFLTALESLSITVRVFLLGESARPQGRAEESVV
jgi:TRAP-type C4-dicarboxylate transport system permease small subunit